MRESTDRAEETSLAREALAGAPGAFDEIVGRSRALREVIEAVEGPLAIIECLRQPGGCVHEGECPAFPYLVLAQERLRESLDVSFAELLAERASEGALLGRMPIEDAAPRGNGHRGRRVRTPDPAAGGEG